jgi:AraC-like DNA-binding protein
VLLSIESAALIKIVTNWIGTIPSRAPDFELVSDLIRPETQRLVRFMRYLVSEIDNEFVELSRPLFAEMEDVLIMMFLFGNRHDLTDTIEETPRSIAPWQVRLAEQYIEANWARPITVAGLATAVGASARSIFKCFRVARGCSPMAFVKIIRLKKAKQMLESGSPLTSVTGVAFACGFYNLGHFANDYARTFGELPSNALKAAKGTGISRTMHMQLKAGNTHSNRNANP